MFILKHERHPEHRKCLFESENGIQNIEYIYISKHKWDLEHRKCFILKHTWHPEHRNIPHRFHSPTELSTNSLRDLVVFWNYDIQTEHRKCLFADPSRRVRPP